MMAIAIAQLLLSRSNCIIAGVAQTGGWAGGNQ
jgi:hypothetical protein